MARVDSRELTEWQIYYGINHFGKKVSEKGMARLTAIVYNAWRGKDSPVLNEEDFMYYKYKEDEPEPPSDEMVKAILGIL